MNSARRSQLRGFTFVELVLGMAVTAMVMVALSAACLAVGEAWRESDYARSAATKGSATTSALRLALRDARYVGYVVTGDLAASSATTASVLYWRADDFDGAANDKVELGEMALIEFDPATKSIVKYEAKDSSAMTSSQRTYSSVELSRSDVVTNANAAKEFKAYLTNTNSGVVTPLLRNVSAATFRVVRANDDSSTARPVVAYELCVESPQDAAAPGRSSRTAVERGVVTLRAASNYGS
jgi:Tfp pilus assembly protein PilW